MCLHIVCSSVRKLTRVLALAQFVNLQARILNAWFVNSKKNVLVYLMFNVTYRSLATMLNGVCSLFTFLPHEQCGHTNYRGLSGVAYIF